MNDLLFVPVNIDPLDKERFKHPLYAWKDPGPDTRISLQEAESFVAKGGGVAIVPAESRLLVIDVDKGKNLEPIYDILGAPISELRSNKEGRKHLYFRFDDAPKDLTKFVWEFPGYGIGGDALYGNALVIAWDLPGVVATLKHRTNVESVTQRQVKDFQDLNEMPATEKRHTTLLKSLCRARNDRQIVRANQIASDAGLLDPEIQDLNAWVNKTKEKKNKPDEYADIFQEQHGSDFVYNSDQKCWLRWSGCRWLNNASTYHDMRDLIKDLLPIPLRRSAFISDIQKLLRDRSHFCKLNSVFDSDDNLLNCPNRQINLVTGKSTDNQRESYCSKITAIAPDELLQIPFWDQFLDDFSDGDKATINLIYRIFFHALTGQNAEKIFIFFGKAGSGKTTLTNVIRKILSDYSLTVNRDALLGKGHQTTLADLEGQRFGVLPEITGSWNLPILKELTGREGEISARPIYEKAISFRPKITMICHSNDLPSLAAVDSAVRSRIVIIPSTSRNFRKETGRIHNLDEIMFKEASGILAKILSHRMDFLADQSFSDLPKKVDEITNYYFDDQDVFGRWFAENITVDDKTTTCLSDLHLDYEEFCQRERIDSPSLSAFGKTMLSEHRERFKRARIDDRRVAIYAGLKLANSLEEF